jgi:hypothetical protein
MPISSARTIATRIRNGMPYNHSDVYRLAKGYFSKDDTIKKLKQKVAHLEANYSKRINEAYERGVRDGLSRASQSPGFGDMGG